MEKRKSFAQYMQQLARRNSISNVFSDFLEMTVCALSLGAMEDRYLEIVRRYDKPEAYLMAEAFGALVMEMDNHGEGLLDVFGEFFMEFVSFGHNGQFFTPEPICTLMARMTMENEFQVQSSKFQVGCAPRVMDCACGSGRILMAAARVNRNALFYGADVDRNCAMMCVINMCLNGMLGEVAWMNSLSNEFYGAWRVQIHESGLGPYIVAIGEEESEIVLKMGEKEVKESREGIASCLAMTEGDLLDDLLTGAPIIKVQQMMFDF